MKPYALCKIFLVFIWGFDFVLGILVAGSSEQLETRTAPRPSALDNSASCQSTRTGHFTHLVHSVFFPCTSKTFSTPNSYPAPQLSWPGQTQPPSTPTDQRGQESSASAHLLAAARPERFGLRHEGLPVPRVVIGLMILTQAVPQTKQHLICSYNVLQVLR